MAERDNEGKAGKGKEIEGREGIQSSQELCLNVPGAWQKNVI